MRLTVLASSRPRVSPLARSFLSSMRRDEGMYSGPTTNTVIVQHGENIARRTIQEAVVKAVGEQSLRIVTPRDRDTGLKKNHSYLVMSTPDVAERLSNEGLEMDGQRCEVRPSPDAETIDSVGNTRQLSFNVPSGVSADAVTEELVRVAGERPASIRAPREPGRPHYATLSSPEVVIRVVANGLEVDGREIPVDYAAERFRVVERPDRPERSDRGGNDRPEREGRNATTVSVVGFPADATQESVREMVFNRTGLTPTRVNLKQGQSNQTVAFIEFSTVAKADKFASFDFSAEGLNSRQQKDYRPVSPKTITSSTRVLAYGQQNISSDDLIAAIERVAGEKVTGVRVQGSLVRFTVSSPEVANKVIEEGVAIGSVGIKLKLLDESELIPTRSIILGFLPRPTNEGEVSKIITDATGIAPVNVVLPREKMFGGSKGFAFVHFNSIEDATKVLNTEMKMDDRVLTTIFLKPAEKPLNSDGSVKGLFNDAHSIPQLILSGITHTAEALTGALKNLFQVDPRSVHVADGKATVTFVDRETAFHVAKTGVTIDGQTIPSTISHTVGRPDLAGIVCNLYLQDLGNATPEEISKTIIETTQITPSLVQRPAGKPFAFVELMTPAEAQKVAESGLVVNGQSIAISYSKPRAERMSERANAATGSSSSSGGARRQGGYSREGGYSRGANRERSPDAGSAGGAGGSAGGAGRTYYQRDNNRTGGERSGGERTGGERSEGGNWRGGERSYGNRGGDRGGDRSFNRDRRAGASGGEGRKFD